MYGYVTWQMMTEISVMYGSEGVKAVCLKRRRSRVCPPLWHSASFKETEKINIVGSLRDREVACSTSDRQA